MQFMKKWFLHWCMNDSSTTVVIHCWIIIPVIIASLWSELWFILFQSFFQLKFGKTFGNAMSINPIIDGHTKVEVLVIWICTIWSQGFTVCQTERKFVKHQKMNCNKPIITIFSVTYIYWKLFWGHCVVKNLSTKSFLITTYYLITSPLPPLVPHH